MAGKNIGRKAGRPKGGGQIAEDRRAKVRTLRNEGYTNIQIAGILQVSRNTVTRDIKENSLSAKKKAAETDGLQEVGETLVRLQEYEDMFNKALRSVDEADIRTRLECINKAANIRMTRIKLAQDTGLIPSIVREKDADIVDTISSMTDIELEKRQKQLIQNLGLLRSNDNAEQAPQSSAAYKKQWEKKSGEMKEGVSLEGSDSYPPLPPLEETLEEASKFFDQKDLDIITGAEYNVKDSIDPSDINNGEDDDE